MSAAEPLRTGLDHYHRATVMYPPDRALFTPFRDPAALSHNLHTSPHLTEPLALYIHVPFCETKCAFCDYATLIGPRFDAPLRQRYVDLLLTELSTWRRHLPEHTTLAGLDLGGGTPLSLSAEQLAALIARVRDLFPTTPDFEVSTETTPTLAHARRDDLPALYDAGIRRISLGVQSLDLDVLAASNRALHAPDLVPGAVEALRAAGFPIVNLDLMFAQLHQSLDSWVRSVDAAIALAPDVITIYDTVYKNRGIARLAARADALPALHTYADHYDAAFLRLRAAGYSGRYGTVNLSRVPGRLGTSRYLEARILDLRPYIGLGLYASSLVGDAWAFRPRQLRAWEDEVRRGDLPQRDAYRLPLPHLYAKSLLLMLSYGFLDPSRFLRRFHTTLADAFPHTLPELLRRGLLLPADDGTLDLAPGAFGLLPGIRAAFMPPDALDLLRRPDLAL